LNGLGYPVSQADLQGARVALRIPENEAKKIVDEFSDAMDKCGHGDWETDDFKLAETVLPNAVILRGVSAIARLYLLQTFNLCKFWLNIPYSKTTSGS
jgi:hypothetical protein